MICPFNTIDTALTHFRLNRLVPHCVLEESNFNFKYIRLCVIKQCRPWSEAAFFSVWSGSALCGVWSVSARTEQIWNGSRRRCCIVNSVMCWCCSVKTIIRCLCRIVHNMIGYCCTVDAVISCHSPIVHTMKSYFRTLDTGIRSRCRTANTVIR